MVHYKKTNTNITIKKNSNHKDSIKKGVIKGYADRARALCDPEYLNDELKNIEQVFEDNGYTTKEIRNAMRKTKNSITEQEEGEEETTKRGIVVMPNVPGFTPQFNKIARKHGFRVANKTDSKVKDLTSKAKTPLGKKNTNIVYKIPCKCDIHVYTGHTDRKWETREKEHEDKVRLTQEDLENGNTDGATKRMNEGDGGLAKHSTTCQHQIDWENAKIVGKEKSWRQRTYLEGIETLRQKNEGKIPLNAYNNLEQWQSVLIPFFEKHK